MPKRAAKKGKAPNDFLKKGKDEQRPLPFQKKGDDKKGKAPNDFLKKGKDEQRPLPFQKKGDDKKTGKKK